MIPFNFSLKQGNMPRHVLFRTAGIALLGCMTVAPLVAAAQGRGRGQGAPASNQASNSSAVPRALSLEDYGKWTRINSAALSSDGKWMTYAYAPNEGTGTLFIRQMDAGTVDTIANGSQPQFSDDARFVAYFVAPAGGRGGAGGGRGGGAPPTAVPPGRGGGAPAAAGGNQRRLELRDLNTGEKIPFANANTFRFSQNSRWLAIRANRAANDARFQGADLIVRDLTSGAMRNIGNVNLYFFDNSGRYLAYTVDAAEKLGNGVYVIDLNDGSTRLLDGAAKEYDGLIWHDKNASLAVLRGEKAEKSRYKDNVLLAWLNIGTPTARNVEYDLSKDATAPKGMILSEFSAPRFDKDGARIFVGLKDQDVQPAPANGAVANVDVWHYKDTEPQSQQLVRLAQESRSTQAAVYDLTANKLVPLADSSMRTVTQAGSGKWGIGRNDATYRGEVSWGGSRADYYRVDLANGDRTLIEKALMRTMGNSPDGRYFLYLKDKKVYSYDLNTGKSAQIDAPAKVSFVDIDDDHPYELPPYGVAGWSKDGKSVLLNHKYDIWQLALDGSKASSLTAGLGDAQKIRFRIVNFEAAGGGGRGGRGGGGFGGGGGDDPGIDLTKPITLQAFGDLTKKSGYWTVNAGKEPTPIIFEDRNIGGVQKASKADRMIFTRQSFTEFPDYWVTNTKFADAKKVTNANPQIAEFLWGSKRLIEYTDSRGNKLQGTLTLPANYEEGKKYPMLVYFYEKMSDTHHNFSMPVYDDRPHISTYASGGYLVLQPDVVYTIGRPGTSAVDDVTSAVKKVIELGYADPAHIGLQGHSWGGYQSSYIITQTDMFAATVTGAPPTNLVSFYDQLYKQTGTVQQGIMEVGQVRMGQDSTPWTARAQYEDQSPVHNVQKIKTPFMILHGTADGAVDYVQGLEYFNAARRNGKNVIFLSYPDEPHHLGKKENQIDFQIRMRQYFDHYLKGAPAPKWMIEGVPATRKGEPPK